MQKPTDLMLCAEMQENLYDYFTGRVSPVLHETIRQHLRDCAACRKEFEDLKITLGLLDQIKPPKVSDGFTERVMNSLEPKVLPFTKRPVYRFIMQGTAAAIVVLAVVSIIKLLPTTDKDISTTRGGATTTVIAEDCKKAIELYNKSTGTPDLKLKESLLKDALAAGCTDNKVLARIHNNLADCYEQQKSFDEAVDEYKKAIECDPSLVEAYLGLGDIHKIKGQIADAIIYYEKAQTLFNSFSSHKTQERKKEKDIKNTILELKKQMQK
jgi:hypothetical protein